MSNQPKPMYERLHGFIGSSKKNYHETVSKLKIPEDQTYKFAGLPIETDFRSAPPVPPRNQRPPRGYQKRVNIDGFNKKAISSASSTERYIDSQTFVDGTKRSSSVSENNIDKQLTKDKLDKQLKKIDEDVSNLNKVLSGLDEVKEPVAYKQVQDAIKTLQDQKQEIKHAINPNFKIEEGIENMVQLLRSMSSSTPASSTPSSSTPASSTPASVVTPIVSKFTESELDAVRDKLFNEFKNEVGSGNNDFEDFDTDLEKDLKALDKSDPDYLNQYEKILQDYIDESLKLKSTFKTAFPSKVISPVPSSSSLSPTMASVSSKKPEDIADSYKKSSKNLEDSAKTASLLGLSLASMARWEQTYNSASDAPEEIIIPLREQISQPLTGLTHSKISKSQKWRTILMLEILNETKGKVDPDAFDRMTKDLKSRSKKTPIDQRVKATFKKEYGKDFDSSWWKTPVASV